MNPLFQMLNGGQAQRPMNRFQRMGQIMQAMQNPAQFVRNAIPDLPAEIANDPNRILQYLQQTRGITNEQIQQIVGQIPHF